MKTRLIVNLLLALVLITLGLVAWLKPGQEQVKPVQLTSFEMSAIHNITIQRRQAQTIKLIQINDEWLITQPINAPALLGTIERLLKISQIKPPVTYPLDTASLEQFGLKEPIVSLTFNNETLLIGRTESVQSRRYVSKEKQLYLLDDTFLHHLTAPLSAYIDNRLLPDGAQIISIQTPALHLQQKDDNSWQNELSPLDVLSPDAVQMLFDEWRFARAITVDNQSEQTISEQITITLDNNKTMAFGVIKQGSEVILVSSEKKLAYTFSVDKYEQMTTLAQLDANDA